MGASRETSYSRASPARWDVSMSPTCPSIYIVEDMWIPMRLRLAGKRLLFAPEATPRDEAFSDGRESSRKARTLAGNYQLLARPSRLLVPFVNPS